MEKSSIWAVGSVVALSALTLAVAHRFTVEAPASMPTPFPLGSSLDRSDVTLSDGRTLSLRDGALSLAGKRIALSSPRRFASLTVMPTGQVLVWGGIDDEGRLVETGEWFEPSTGALVTTGRLGLPPRAAHTLNVLSDGTLAMTGGWGVGNVPAHDVALWRPLDRHLDLLAGDPAHVRMKSVASLLADGTLQIVGGVDEIGRPINEAWLFGRSEAITAVKPHGVVASLPTKDKSGASPIGPLALRFSEPVDVAGLGGTVSLLGPSGVVKTRVIGTEGGRLVFVQLPDELYPSARYTIFVQGLHTAKGDVVPYEAIGFTTKAARGGVVLAGEGHQPGTTAPDSAQPPIFVMAGAGKVAPCKPVDAFHLCRDKGQVKDGAFYPGQDNVATSDGGHWRLYRDRQMLPDTKQLEADLPKGSTALIGQVRQIDESPIANVEISVDGQKVRTDGQGVFVLQHVLAGRRELFVDGRPAGSANTEYGRFIVGADVTASTVNHMPFVMYLPRVLDRDKIALPSPTTRETVLTHPDMPGLELRIPAGAVFKDRDGKVLNEIAIVPTPVDHAPFPLPDNFPMYFTIQPGDAVVQGMTPEAAKGIQVVYPNYGKQKPADKADFWVYSAEKGWDMYGTGHVSGDASQLVADKETRLVWALGAGASTNPPQEDNGKKPNNKCAADPVDLKTGQFLKRWQDLSVADVMPLSIDRTATNLAAVGSPFGRGTGTALNLTLSAQQGFDTPRLVLACGEAIEFHLVSGQAVWPLVGTVWRHSDTQSVFYGATLQFLNDSTAEGAHWIVTLKDGSQYWFNRHAPNNLYRRVDRAGNVTQYLYNGGLLSQIVSPNGRTIDIGFTSNNVIGKVSDQLGRTVHYEYASFSGTQSALDGWMLKRVTYPDGTSEEYTHRMVDGVQAWLIESIKDRSGTVQFTNQFETKVSGVVTGQVYTDGSSTSIAYERGGADNSIMAATVTDQNGHKERTEFDPVSGYPIAETLAYGTPLAQTRRTERSAAGQVLSRTDIAGRKTNYQYDTNGNVTAVTRMAGTSDESTVRYTYTNDARIASMTDALGNKTEVAYEGACASILTDATGRSVHFTCNGAGRLTSVSNDAGSTYQLGYSGGDLISITDPLGSVTHFVYDVVGRRVATIAADGSVTQSAFDSNDRIISLVDGDGKMSHFDYDSMGDLIKASLPNGSELTFDFDNMGHRVSSADALGREEKFGYDAKGNLTSFEDRKRQVTTITYNELDLPTLKTFADGSGISYTYGTNNRPVEALDTSGGRLAWAYDLYDHVSSETTPQGSISYTYDFAGRRTGMSTSDGQSLAYDYDAGNRLLAIRNGQGAYRFDYDISGRRSSLSFPNGVSARYSYDAAGSLVDLSYRDSSNTVLSESSYSYDSVGRRLVQGGNVGTMILPGATASDHQFDLANRVTVGNAASYAYDENGNLTSDGARTFTWNARNQLVKVSSGGSDLLAFGYDALGRRITKTSDVTKIYRYDGLSEVAETVGGKTFLLITGDSVDEKLSRTDGSTSEYYLADALGSSVALTDSQGRVSTRYGYDAYGKTQGIGTSTENRYLYTGRELDDDDLYYYRSRYYVPSEGRFLSEDSLGLLSGQLNNYQYVGSAPTTYTDPSGHCPTCLVGAIVGGLIGGVTGYISDGWRGAAAGALAGTVTGALGGLIGPAAGAIGNSIAGSIGAALARGGATAAYGALSGAAGTIAGNLSANKPAMKRAGYGATLGALAPLMSGEAGVAAAGDIGLGLAGESVFGGLSGVIGGIGGVLDPLGDCAESEPQAPPPPDNHFPWASMNF
ncbi:RHS repeat domain-containing protein [Luteibacter sp. 9135]|uniref:RHS repeat domain-containing protein n=1 Tax=Luteibacter sp. 9135 TaxID=1500893 RepID=UPI00163B0053|nr:RHS repeat protein [Luteibacter sp. 9135]